MNKKTLLWLIPVLTTVHNFEEALFMPAWLDKRNSLIPNSLSGFLVPITYKQFLLALFLMTATPYLVAWFSVRQGGIGEKLLLSLQVAMFINVFAHLGIAVMMGGYAPGVVTAVFCNLPFSIYLLRCVIQEQWVSDRELKQLGLIGLFLHVVMLPVIIILAGRLVRYF